MSWLLDRIDKYAHEGVDSDCIQPAGGSYARIRAVHLPLHTSSSLRRSYPSIMTYISALVRIPTFRKSSSTSVSSSNAFQAERRSASYSTLSTPFLSKPIPTTSSGNGSLSTYSLISARSSCIRVTSSTSQKAATVPLLPIILRTLPAKRPGTCEARDLGSMAISISRRSMR